MAIGCLSATASRSLCLRPWLYTREHRMPWGTVGYGAASTYFFFVVRMPTPCKRRLWAKAHLEVPSGQLASRAGKVAACFAFLWSFCFAPILPEEFDANITESTNFHGDNATTDQEVASQDELCESRVLDCQQNCQFAILDLLPFLETAMRRRVSCHDFAQQLSVYVRCCPGGGCACDAFEFPETAIWLQRDGQPPQFFPSGPFTWLLIEHLWQNPQGVGLHLARIAHFAPGTRATSRCLGSPSVSEKKRIWTKMICIDRRPAFLLHTFLFQRMWSLVLQPIWMWGAKNWGHLPKSFVTGGVCENPCAHGRKWGGNARQTDLQCGPLFVVVLHHKNGHIQWTFTRCISGNKG